MRGFLSAGTTTVLASLWRVSDDSAGHMMTRFHENVRDGTAAADALRQAVPATRDHSDRWSAMHHWAPFVLVGNWEVR